MVVSSTTMNFSCHRDPQYWSVVPYICIISILFYLQFLSNIFIYTVSRIQVYLVFIIFQKNMSKNNHKECLKACHLIILTSICSTQYSSQDDIRTPELLLYKSCHPPMAPQIGYCAVQRQPSFMKNANLMTFAIPQPSKVYWHID